MKTVLWGVTCKAVRRCCYAGAGTRQAAGRFHGPVALGTVGTTSRSSCCEGVSNLRHHTDKLTSKLLCCRVSRKLWWHARSGEEEENQRRQSTGAHRNMRRWNGGTVFDGNQGERMKNCTNNGVAKTNVANNFSASANLVPGCGDPLLPYPRLAAACHDASRILAVQLVEQLRNRPTCCDGNCLQRRRRAHACWIGCMLLYVIRYQ